MPNQHDRGDELSLETEGELLSESDVKEMVHPAAVDYPMPGEVAHPEEHVHPTLKDIEDNE